jgi:phage head maturation protease
MKREAPQKGERVYRAAEIEKSSDKPRTISFIASDETVDRYGDIIRVEGWDLTQYKKNPVMLFGHNSREPPIGTTDVRIEGKQLLADATFLPEGVSDFADEIWRIVDAGALRAMSVGFLPTAMPTAIWAEDDPEHEGWPTGYEFNGQELLENSVVPVPANPAALALARSVASARTIRRLFTDDARALAHVAAESRRRSIQLARLRAG